MNYGELINKSFKTVWQNKVIWLFGILFTLFGGSGGGGGNFNFGGGNFGGSTAEPDNAAAESFNKVYQSVVNYVTHHWEIIIGAAIFLFLLFLVMIFMNAVFKGSLVGLVKRVDEGEEVRAKEGFAIGFRNALPILLRSILLGIAGLIVIAIPIIADALLFVWAFSSEPSPSIGILIIAIILAIVFVIAIIAFAIFLGLIDTFADRYIVLENARIVDSIKKAYALINSNWGKVAMSWLVMVGLGIAAGIVLMILAIIVFIPVILVIVLNVIAGLVIAVPLVLLLLIPAGFIQAFSSAYWTYVYLDLADKEDGAEPQGFASEGLATT